MIEKERKGNRRSNQPPFKQTADNYEYNKIYNDRPNRT